MELWSAFAANCPQHQKLSTHPQCATRRLMQIELTGTFCQASDNTLKPANRSHCFPGIFADLSSPDLSSQRMPPMETRTKSVRSAESRTYEGRRQNVLYLSYDGLTDPLGRSQVLPYLAGLAARGHRISIISFEKSGQSEQSVEAVSSTCADAGIAWHPLPYHKRPPILSTMFDLAVMKRLAERLHKGEHFDIVHCRSYLSAMVGLAMKRRHGTRFLFDMRGFWADERVDGRIWNLANPLFRIVYRYFKKRESEFLREADHVVSLTQEGKKVLLERADRRADHPPLTVIPCCVDFGSFVPVDAARRAQSRELLGIAPDRRVAAYLGSIGTWYMFDEMLNFFRVQLDRAPESLFLLITRNNPTEILAAAAAKGVPPESLLIRGATREEVPLFVAAADYGLFFIKPVFSKKASSPTKMGEFLALELPIVTNGNVGDVAQIVAETGAGVVVERFDDAAYRDALDRLERQTFDLDRWRKQSRHWFDLETAVERYDAIYRDDAAVRKMSTSLGA